MWDLVVCEQGFADFVGVFFFFAFHCSSVNILIWFGCARTDKAAVAYTVPVEHPKVHLEQVNSQPSTCNSEPACTRSSSDEQEDINVSKNEQKSRLPLEMNKTYKPPVIPEERNFQAVVSCVGSDGTLYIIPKSSGKFTWKEAHVCLWIRSCLCIRKCQMCSTVCVLYGNVVQKVSS